LTLLFCFVFLGSGGRSFPVVARRAAGGKKGVNMRKEHPRLPGLALGAGLCLAVLGQAVHVGAAQAPTATQRFGETAQVTVVQVRVQVVKDGEPVRGLTADNFEVYDGRKKQKVTGFEVLDLYSAAGQPQAAAAAVPAAARRHFLIIFDLSFSE